MIRAISGTSAALRPTAYSSALVDFAGWRGWKSTSRRDERSTQASAVPSRGTHALVPETRYRRRHGSFCPASVESSASERPWSRLGAQQRPAWNPSIPCAISLHMAACVRRPFPDGRPPGRRGHVTFPAQITCAQPVAVARLDLPRLAWWSAMGLCVLRPRRINDFGLAAGLSQSLPVCANLPPGTPASPSEGF